MTAIYLINYSTSKLFNVVWILNVFWSEAVIPTYQGY
jgi:hypothetical protein